MIFWLASVIVFAFAGWFAYPWFYLHSHNGVTPSFHPIREKNADYPLINPLLACDFNDRRTVGENADFKRILLNGINNAVKNGKIDKISVYFKDYKNDTWISINPDERYSEASLGKVPILMSYLKLAESGQPDLLNQKITYKGGNSSLNSAQEIHPASELEGGQSYTIAELLARMIIYSDNDSADILLRGLPEGYLSGMYDNLDIQDPSAINGQDLPDFITAKSYSLFFRILYNSTYLSEAQSESALDLLSKTDFKSGLAAGVPKNIVVAHKFGLLSRTSDGTLNTPVNFRELHDCGIIYNPGHPYLLCVMTKTSHDLASAEEVISQISQNTYEYVQSH